MFIVQRHYLKEFFKALLLVAAGLGIIFSILDLIDKIDDFLPYSPTFEKLLLYVLYIFPRYLLYLLPMATLLCGLFVFSHAKKLQEITAIKVSGYRLRNLLAPFLAGGVGLSIFGFFLGEFIVPEFSKEAQALKEDIMKRDKHFSFKEGTVWFRAADGSIVKIGLYMPGRKISRNISIFRVSNGSLAERIEAQEAEWSEADSKVKWRLKNAIVYGIDSGSIEGPAEIEYPLMESPTLFDRGIRKPEEMGIGELFRYIRRLEEAGFRNLKLNVDLHAKISYPFINFFMILLGISLPLRGWARGGLVMTAVGIFISLLYWFGHAMFLSMGYAGIIPPQAATWIVPVVFGFAAIRLFREIQE